MINIAQLKPAWFIGKPKMKFIFIMWKKIIGVSMGFKFLYGGIFSFNLIGNPGNAQYNVINGG